MGRYTADSLFDSNAGDECIAPFLPVTAPQECQLNFSFYCVSFVFYVTGSLNYFRAFTMDLPEDMVPQDVNFVFVPEYAAFVSRNCDFRYVVLFGQALGSFQKRGFLIPRPSYFRRNYPQTFLHAV